MGLVIHSIAEFPKEAKRDYYIYLLDYGWNEPLGSALFENFERIVSAIRETDNAVVIKRTQSGIHFSDEVLSWHMVNGEDASRILPAILITNRHPQDFKERFTPYNKNFSDDDYKMILIPLKKFCNNTTEVIDLISQIISDIKDKKDLSKFKIAKELKKGVGKAIVDSIILEPNIQGIGFSFNKLKTFFKK